jgi:hypothetical protein
VAAGTLEDPYEYYELLRDRPERIRTVRLQSVADINTYAKGGGGYWTYDPASDAHPEKQDAVKLVFPHMSRVLACTTVYGKVNIGGTLGTVVSSGWTLVNPATGYTYRTNGGGKVGPTGYVDNADAVAGKVDAEGNPIPPKIVPVRVDAVTPVGELYRAEAPVGTVLHWSPPRAGLDPTVVVAPSQEIEVKCSDSLPTTNQIKMPIGIGDGTILYTWDWFYTSEWRTHRGSIGAFKMFKTETGGTATTVEPWWTKLLDTRRRTTDVLTVGTYHDAAALSSQAPGFISGKPVNPTGEGAAPANTFQQYVGRWTRYWVEIKLNRPASDFTDWANKYNGGVEIPANTKVGSNGLYHMNSVWIADEQRDAVCVLYRAPAWPNKFVTEFKIEINTSDQAPARTGDWFGYVRGFNCLHNYNLPANGHLNDPLIFQRPVRG